MKTVVLIICRSGNVINVCADWDDTVLVMKGLGLHGVAHGKKNYDWYNAGNAFVFSQTEREVTSLN